MVFNKMISAFLSRGGGRLGPRVRRPYRDAFRNFPNGITISILLAALFAGRSEARGAVLTVRKDGTGNYTTIQAGVNAMAARDTCLVGPGIYAERVTFPSGKSGSAGNLTIVKAETPGAVEMRGFDTANCHYLRIEGFNVSVPTNMSSAGFSLRSSNLQIVSNYIHDVNSIAIRGYANTTNNWVYGNRIYNMGYGIHIYGENHLIEANDLERLRYYAPNGDADYIIFFGRNHVLRNNYLHGSFQSEIGPAHVDGFQSWDNNGEYAQHIRVEGNRVTGFYHQGLLIAATYYTNSFDLTICNNIFEGAQAWGVDVFNGVKDAKIFNNLFKDINSFAVGVNQGATGEVRNNIFYNVCCFDTATPASIGSKNIWYRPGYTLGSRFNGDLVNVNPQFVDVTKGDYRLRWNSPAINAGVPLAEVPYDLAGVARSQGSGWDIGLYEFVPTDVRMLTPSNQNGNITFTLVGEAGRSYRIEASSNFLAWADLGPVTLTNGSAQISRPMTGGRQFYRARLLP